MSILSTLRPLAAGGAEPTAGGSMVDLSFTIEAERLPHGYVFPLEAALLAALPWLAEETYAGIHPIRAPVTTYGVILSRRARLVLRIPEERVAAARGLTGQSLPIGETRLAIGEASLRRIEPFATLRAWSVATSAVDEEGFVEDVALQLEVLDIKARMICGRPQLLADGDRRIAGFGLALHELSAAHSLLLQAQGLGAARRLGCGLFVHHKLITGLGEAPE